MHAAQGLCAELYPQLLSFSLGSNALEEAKCPVEEPQEESLPVGRTEPACGRIDPSEDELRSSIRARLGPRPLPALGPKVCGSRVCYKAPSAGRSSRRPNCVLIASWGAALWRPVTCS